MEWISVKDELPESDGFYLTHWTDGTLETFKTDEECAVDDLGGYCFTPVTWQGVEHSVTHWMPLPEPPK